MTVTTKFDIGDYAWHKYEDKWYMIQIDAVCVNKFYNNVTAKPVLSITYTGIYAKITGRPPRNKMKRTWEKWDAFNEFELYTKEEKEKAESE